MEKLHDLKFFAKPPKGKMKGLLIVFAWIILWNFIYQAVHGAWHDMPIANWAFFISVTIFFMQEELTYKGPFLAHAYRRSRRTSSCSRPRYC